MTVAGNLLTHYNYPHARVNVREEGPSFTVDVETPARAADLHVVVDLEKKPMAPPEQSPFTTWRQARLFAGPLPFTFDYEPETHSLVLIEGVRQHWNPQPITVDVARVGFFDRAPFNRVKPILANAFHVANIDYRWNRGVVEALDPRVKATTLMAAFS
jgi:hypothetical protein